ncbi:hypothetical protein C0995_006494 [Termitomyces sp. Mi166|nr:hypothetical protein C0995_006494 [Termitomyces sp. Mi166\
MTDLIDLDYMLCDTDLAIRKAASVLGASTLLALDCEGRNLGDIGGKLSLISLRVIRPAHSAQTFLIDTVRLKGEKLRPIYDILESTSIRKVVYDDRKDFSCLFHDRRVEIRNVMDLQLADVKSREIRGENDADRIRRLGQMVPEWELSRNPHLYKNIHKLPGMKKSAEEHLGLKMEKNAVKFALLANEIFLGHATLDQTGAVVRQGSVWSAVRQKSFMNVDFNERPSRNKRKRIEERAKGAKEVDIKEAVAVKLGV